LHLNRTALGVYCIACSSTWETCCCDLAERVAVLYRYDVIVVGLGGVGSAAAFHLARRGASVLGLDRFPPAHDRGSSHGETRIIRQAYYEHPDYVPLTLRAYQLWAELEQRRQEQLFYRTGLLQIGPLAGRVLTGVKDAARRHSLELEELTCNQIESRWPGFRVPEGMAGVVEPKAGYLKVENCVLAHLLEAAQAGAEIRTGEIVVHWKPNHGGVIVQSEKERYLADRLVLAAGPWASQLLHDLGIPLQVRRKPLYWFQTATLDYHADLGCPAFIYELPEGIFYGFPRIDELGLKVARHSGGDLVSDPLLLDRDVDPVDKQLVEAFLGRYLPQVTHTLLKHVVCMYTMSPDEHFLVDHHPHYRQVALAAGLSGHGFKFTCVLGEALADLALRGKTELPIGFLNCRRASLATPAQGPQPSPLNTHPK
jgi:sarcosine oxidase